jgi:hypothetical protein
MPDNFDDNPVISNLRRAYFGSDNASPEHVWDDYRTIFTALPQEHRRQELLAIDDYLAAGDLKATRETAATISMRRQLGDLDGMLRKVGR